MTNTGTLALKTETRDETAEIMKSGYRLARVVAVPDLDVKLRAEVRWDSYEKQSFAAVSVLSDELKWTHLASEPTSEWYAAAPSVYQRGISPEHVISGLGPVADRLVSRAVEILR